MATIATKFGRFFAQEAGDAAGFEALAVVPDALTRVRPFANEDIYFFVKHIDNTAVIRQADPASQRASWRMIGGAAAAAIAAVFLLMPKGYSLLANYEIQQLLVENAHLQVERAELEGQEAALMSPENMAQFAKQQQFIDPAPDRIVQMNPSEHGQVASNAPISAR